MTTEAQKTLRDLLKSGNIGQAVYVDDIFAFNDAADVEQMIGWFTQALEKSQDQALALVKITYPVPDDDIWRTEFRTKWMQLESSDRTGVINGLIEILNSQLSKDRKVATILNDLFPEKFLFHEISPSTWLQQRDRILAETPKNTRLVCLFDQDLSAELGFTEIGARSGGGLLKELIEGQQDPSILCGILSHTIASIEAEHAHHGTFASENGLSSENFLPLAKSRLDAPMNFVDGFKKLLLHKYGESIKQSALSVIGEGHKAAVQRIQSLDIYAFDRIILQAAHWENEWEIDTIVRLFQIFQRNEVRLRLSDLDTANSLSELIAKARPTSQVETVVEEYVYPRVNKIRIDELYEKADLIRYRPLESGDIFVCNEGTEQQQFYILLGQPCDLAVRLKDGKRIQEFISLIPIVIEKDQYKNKRTRSKWQEYWSTQVILDKFSTDPKEVVILQFKNALSVRASVLDLAVLNSDGVCRIDICDVVVPAYLPEGWQSLFVNRIEFYTQLAAKLALLNGLSVTDSVRNELQQAILPEFSFPSNLPGVVYDNGKFDFGLKRVKRYRQPGTDGLLKSFMQFLSREAKEFDFAK